MTSLTLNGESIALVEPATVEAMVGGLGRPLGGLAVAVNGQVIPRSAWAATKLADGDQVEVLTAVQGG